MANRYFSRYLSTDGTTSGTKDMSTTADEYYIVDTTQSLDIYRMIVTYQDGTGGNVSEYANLNAALTTGIEVKVIRRDGSTVLQDLTDGLPVKTNGDWARLCYDAQLISWGGGDDYFCVRWTFTRGGSPIRLEPGQSLRMIINDDLTNVTNHWALVQGQTV
ncbi:MAG: hypothetical protein JSW00_08920 [Thermoplasmata archaeon]|nr:MAG: hypothetical protein JSW00_08920 [Thermoplasmata archaeon]